MPLKSEDIAEMVSDISLALERDRENFVEYANKPSYEPFSNLFVAAKRKRKWQLRWRSFMHALKTIATHVLFCVFVLSLLANVFLFRACESFRQELMIRRAIDQIQDPGPVLPPQIHRLPKEA